MAIILDQIDTTEVKWTVSALKENYENNISVYDNAVQRGEVWDDERKSLFIHSLIMNYLTPSLYATKNDDVYSFLDGKQRSFAIFRFIDDEYRLTGLEEVDPIVLYDKNTNKYEKIYLNGMCFSELPEEIKTQITSKATLTIVVANDVSEDEAAEIFFRLNNGKPLNAITVSRVKAKCRNEIVELGSHKIFEPPVDDKDKSKLVTKTALEKYTNEDIVVKSWMVLHEDAPSLETKVVRPFMETLEITYEGKEQLSKCFDRIVETHDMIPDKKIAKRLYTRTHMISIMRVVWDSIQKGYSAQQFVNWFQMFFSGKRSASISKAYNDAAGAGSAKAASVQKRLEEVDKNYKAFFNINDNAEVFPEDVSEDTVGQASDENNMNPEEIMGLQDDGIEQDVSEIQEESENQSNVVSLQDHVA